MFVKELQRRVKEILGHSERQSCVHRWGHISRVYKIAMILGRELDADLEVLAAASLLHDISRTPAEREDHANQSAKIATEVLCEIEFPKEKIGSVIHAILSHSSTDVGVKPKTLEARILYDADKIDGLGAIGLARTFALGGEKGLSPEEMIKWYMKKIRKFWGQSYTEPGKTWLLRRYRFVEIFHDKLNEELDFES